MGNPGAAGVAQAQRPGVARDAFDIVPVTLERKVAADRLELVGRQHLPELFRRQVVGAGQFDLLDAIAAHFLETARDVAGELGAQAVELQADWFLE